MLALAPRAARLASLVLAAALLLGGCGDDSLGPEPFSEPLADITASGNTTCALTVSGKAYCWGHGYDGQLGDGATRDRFAPVPVRTSLRFASISAGYYHTCALTEAGEAWCWGASRPQEGSGQIGNGSRVGGEEPERVQTSLRFIQITAGQLHTCALTVDGEAYCWGGNSYGQLGDGTTTDRTRPVAVAGGLRFRQLSAGADFTCGVTLEGAGYCWGLNSGYRLGTEEPGERCAPAGFACSTVPVAVAGGHSFAGISAGQDHVCGWTAAGTAYCWGRNPNGGLGTGDVTPASTPREVIGGVSYGRLDVGSGFSCGIDVGGRAYCWGTNGWGQLGNPATTGDGCRGQSCSETPVAVAGSIDIRKIDAGLFHVCGLTSDGVAYCWGSNWYGQLGVGDAKLEICDSITDHPCSRIPVPVEGQEFMASGADQ